MTPIFDSHVHIYPDAIAGKAVKALGEFYTFPVGGEGTYTDLTEAYRPLGLCGMLLFCVATNPKQVMRVNDSIAGAVSRARGDGFAAIGFGGMHQDYPAMREEVGRCASLGLRGIKLHPDIQGEAVDSEQFLPLYEELERRGMFLYLHVGDNRPAYRFSSPDRVRRIALQFPSLRIIAAHLGGYMAWDEAPVLYGLENVFFDCSSTLWALRSDDTVRLLRACGVSRVLYGTDYPVMTPARHLALFNALPLTDAEREEILIGNARRLFGI